MATHRMEQVTKVVITDDCGENENSNQVAGDGEDVPERKTKTRNQWQSLWQRCAVDVTDRRLSGRRSILAINQMVSAGLRNAFSSIHTIKYFFSRKELERGFLKWMNPFYCCCRPSPWTMAAHSKKNHKMAAFFGCFFLIKQKSIKRPKFCDLQINLRTAQSATLRTTPTNRQALNSYRENSTFLSQRWRRYVGSWQTCQSDVIGRGVTECTFEKTST